MVLVKYLLYSCRVEVIVRRNDYLGVYGNFLYGLYALVVYVFCMVYITL